MTLLIYTRFLIWSAWVNPDLTITPCLRLWAVVGEWSKQLSLLVAVVLFAQRIKTGFTLRALGKRARASRMLFPVSIGMFLGFCYAFLYVSALSLALPGKPLGSLVIGAGLRALEILVVATAGYTLAERLDLPNFRFIRAILLHEWSRLQASRQALIMFAMLWFATVAFSLLLFRAFEIRVGPAFQSEMWRALAARPAAATMMLVATAIPEEIIYRQFLLSLFVAIIRPHMNRRATRGIAVVVTSLLFALAHLENAQPAAVKVLQSMLLGGAVGLCYVEFGVESAILFHALFNLAPLVLL